MNEIGGIGERRESGGGWMESQGKDQMSDTVRDMVKFLELIDPIYFYFYTKSVGRFFYFN